MKAAPRKALQALVFVKEKIQGAGGFFSKLSRLSRLMPYGKTGVAGEKIKALLAEDQPQSLEPGKDKKLSAEERAQKLQEAADKIAQDAAGPEFDPLSMEPAMLERAREASLLARTAMNLVLEVLS